MNKLKNKTDFEAEVGFEEFMLVNEFGSPFVFPKEKTFWKS